MGPEPSAPSPGRVRLPRSAVPPGGCVAAGDDAQVLVVDTGDGLAAYRNRCLHVGRRLDGGVIRDQVLTCPHHLWRYAIDDGRCVAGGAAAHERGLTPLAVSEHGDVVEITVPPDVTVGIREQLLTHARTWRRDP